MNESYYDTAQICLNGHVINTTARDYPNSNQKYCSQCGEITTMNCANCKAPIRGRYHMRNVAVAFDYIKPLYCHQCGTAYPWTSRVLEAADQYIAELDKLDADEKVQLKSSVETLMKDSPQAVVAETLFKKLVRKAGVEAAGGLRQIIIDVVSETVKKSLFQP